MPSTTHRTTSRGSLRSPPNSARRPHALSVSTSTAWCVKRSSGSLYAAFEHEWLHCGGRSLTRRAQCASVRVRFTNCAKRSPRRGGHCKVTLNERGAKEGTKRRRQAVRPLDTLTSVVYTFATVPLDEVDFSHIVKPFRSPLPFVAGDRGVVEPLKGMM